MTDALMTSLKVSGSALDAQATRLRVTSENLANAQSTSLVSGGDPYQRKLVNMTTQTDGDTGAAFIDVLNIGRDTSAFPVRNDPGHIAADENGYVKMPNVNALIEIADVRDANRSYQANLQVLKQARDLITMTIDLMRAGR